MYNKNIEDATKRKSPLKDNPLLFFFVKKKIYMEASLVDYVFIKDKNIGANLVYRLHSKLGENLAITPPKPPTLYLIDLTLSTDAIKYKKEKKNLILKLSKMYPFYSKARLSDAVDFINSINKSNKYRVKGGFVVVLTSRSYNPPGLDESKKIKSSIKKIMASCKNMKVREVVSEAALLPGAHRVFFAFMGITTSYLFSDMYNTLLTGE